MGYLILKAVQPSLDQGIFFRLLLGTVAMLASGYAGEAKFVAPMAGFVFGMSGWGFILFEIFMGPAGQAAGQQSNKYVLNLVYNLADFVNKIAFVLAIWV